MRVLIVEDDDVQRNSILALIGEPFPETRRDTILALLKARLKLKFRGLKFQPRNESEIPMSELLRVDTCRAVGIGLSSVDTIRGAVFQTRYLLLALDAGDLAVEQVDEGPEQVVEVVLREGMNREVRRVFAKFGLKVKHLKRIRIGRLELGSLGEGRYRVLTKHDLDLLMADGSVPKRP